MKKIEKQDHAHTSLKETFRSFTIELLSFLALPFIIAGLLIAILAVIMIIKLIIGIITFIF